ncbi:hypothetical protein ACC754_44120, partial [Rhizobium johnstonii]
ANSAIPAKLRAKIFIASRRGDSSSATDHFQLEPEANIGMPPRQTLAVTWPFPIRADCSYVVFAYEDVLMQSTIA